MKQLSMMDIWSNPPKPSYHQTTDLPIKELIKKEAKARRQEDIVLDIFKKHIMLSPGQLMKIWEKENDPVPITSLRRAITNLTNAGYLVKTKIQTKGLYSDPEHVWKYISPE